MHIQRIAHIAIAVKDLETQIAHYRDTFGLELVGREEVADQKVKVAMLRVGETTIELLEPTSPDSPVAKFLDKRGEGIHHLAFQVDGLASALGELRDKGVALLDAEPRDGAHGQRIAFLHPRATFGVLTELCEPGAGPDGDHGSGGSGNPLDA